MPDRAAPLRLLLWACVTGLGVASLMALLAEVHWIYAIMAHGRVQLLAFGLVLLIWSLLARAARMAVISGLLTLLHLLPVWPYLLPVSDAPVASHLRLMTYNMHGDRANVRALADLLRQEKPDVVLLTELPPDWDGFLAGQPDLPPLVQLSHVDGSPMGVALFSRWQVRERRVLPVPSDLFPITLTDLCREDACFRLIGLHAIWPLFGMMPYQAIQLETAGRLAAESPLPVVVMGDLNATPFSPGFSELLAAGRLSDAGRGRSWQASWLSTIPVLGLKIDHVLVSAGIAVASYRIGPYLGSDHRPLLVDVAVVKE